MDTEKIFKRLGLAKHAYPVYRILEKQGPMLAAVIAKDLKLHRPSVYAALASLSEHHFICTVIRGKRKCYKITDPSLIAIEYAKASSQVAKEMEKLVSSNKNIINEKVRFLEGKNGIREAFDDVISHTPRGETFYRYTSEKDLDEVNSYLSEEYRIRRDAKKLERLVISNPLSGEQKRPRLERFIKYMPEKHTLFDQNVIEIIYGDRISFIDLNSEKVIIVENKAMAEFQKVIFQQLYRALP
jgi:sugar-specific transcriptional regulator TrmB